MILVTRLDRQQMYLNPDHIISVEETPDTVITLYNGNHILVRDHARVILNRIIAFKTRLLRRSAPVPAGRGYLRRQHNRLFAQTTHSHDHAGSLQPLHHQDI